MFTKIILGSDGSEYARNAAMLVSEIARRFASEVLVLNAFDVSFATEGVIGMWAVAIDQQVIDACMKGEREAAERVVRPVFEQSQRSYRMLQEPGHPVQTILNVAEREKADLIVVGSHGRTRLEELFLGGVSHGVLHHAHCPVLIERGPAKPFQRILLASDGSAEARKAAAAAFALAKRFNACLTVLNVFEPTSWFATSGEDPNPIVATDEKIVGEINCRRVEESVQAAAAESEVIYDLHQEKGHAGEAIVSYAGAGGFDLIVLGSRGLGGFDRLLLGSVSNYVAYHAECPILVVR